YYVDVELGGTAPGTNIWQYRGNGRDSQLWAIEDAGDGTFHIIGKSSTHYLGSEPDNNVAILLNDGSDELRWEFTPAGPPLDLGITAAPELVSVSEDGTTDTFDVVLDGAPTSDVVLLLGGTNNTDEYTLSVTELTFTPANWDVAQTVTVNGVDEADVDGVQYFDIDIVVDDTRSDAAYFGFSTTVEGYNSDDDGGGVGPPDIGTYRILNRGNTGTLQEPTSSLIREANITSETGYSGQDNEHFALEYFGDGYYQLRAIHSNLYADVELGSTAPGTNVWQYTSNGRDSQLWQLVDAGDGTFHIISKLSGHYLGAEPDDNVAVLLNDGSDELRWEFERINFAPDAVATSDVTGGEAPLTVSFTGDQST
ncbi:RICIN domain-containing protein, partial [uncultured Croceitalea sp.]|uniref:RICIN domain-containing protein n=1 Tax=uncultured Croceitalea sp. TaxID=1798908 RepID=UPI003305BF76